MNTAAMLKEEIEDLYLGCGAGYVRVMDIYAGGVYDMQVIVIWDVVRVMLGLGLRLRVVLQLILSTDVHAVETDMINLSKTTIQMR